MTALITGASSGETIANELKGTGVTVTAVCPGPTDSGFRAAASLAFAPRLFPRAIIRKVVRAVQEPRAANTAKGAI